ncbi:hypothetical protein VNI00_015544 [Paramarasmius palmivorus]|uniref:Uncharacterized protein n=1 Tax=Paramarasmius palmivorus TaxID=297713 RepID=A0AAW0BJV9_9AGAR
MSNVNGDDNTDSPFGWNISKLCDTAHHLRIAPEYSPYICEPEIFSELSLPLPLYQPEHEWYILLTVHTTNHLKPGIYRDRRAITSQFPKGTLPDDNCILRYANSLDEAREIWRKQCFRHHRSDQRHETGQEMLDNHAYSTASLAKAALVHKELLMAYPRFRPRRRRPALNGVGAVDNGSISIGPSSATLPTNQSATGDNLNWPELDGWKIYTVHAKGQRRHLCLEYALGALQALGPSAPARMVLAQSRESARNVFEVETGIRTESSSSTS